MNTKRHALRRFVRTAVCLGILAAMGIAGCSRHPSEVAGTWQVGTNVTVTFAPSGAVVLNGNGGVPPIFADLHNLGHWEILAGKLRLTARDPGRPERTTNYGYELQRGGTVLRISTGGTAWSLIRQ